MIKGGEGFCHSQVGLLREAYQRRGITLTPEQEAHLLEDITDGLEQFLNPFHNSLPWLRKELSCVTK